MRIFDSVVTRIIITALSCCVAFVNIFLIYAVWKHSPKSMGKFKLYMMKMSVADLLFASSIAFLFLPNLLFPLPACIVAGLMKYFGPSGGLIAYWITMVAGGCMMVSICQCCIYRMYVFYRFDWLLETSIKYFKLLTFGETVIICLFIVPGVYINNASYNELIEYATRHGHSVAADITLQTPLVAFDLDKWNVDLALGLVGIFLFFVGILNGISNVTVHKKINKNKASLSRETFRIQKTLTIILLAQALIPGVSIAIPVIVYCVAMAFSFDALLQSSAIEWFSVLIVGAYPFVNSVFCLYYMKPYR